MNDQHVEQFSTIFNCQEGFLACSLRGIEGIICCIMTYCFIQGYIIISKDRLQLIKNEDKLIYLLSMAQVILLSVYYLLFQEFFLLATIRNLLIWTNVLILAILCKVYFIKKEELEKVSYGIQALRGINFLLWFYVAVVQGTEQVNTAFNLGYNCLIPDWVVLSGYLVIVSLLCVFVGIQIYDRSEWEIKNLNLETNQAKSFQQNLIIYMVATIVPALMMFIWDFVAFLYSKNEQDCVDIFVGNNLQRKILFFIVKIITMQTQPLGVYYITFYKNRESFNLIVNNSPNEIGQNNIYLIEDDTPSVLNQSFISRGSSRASLTRDLSRKQLF